MSRGWKRHPLDKGDAWAVRAWRAQTLLVDTTVTRELPVRAAKEWAVMRFNEASR